MENAPKRLIDKNRLVAQILKRVEVARKTAEAFSKQGGDPSRALEWNGRALALVETAKLIVDFTEEPGT